MLFVDFLDAKYGMAEAMDTLIGGPEPLYSRTPHRLDVPIKALVAGGVATGVFRDDIEPHDCSARSLACHTLGQARTGSGRQFGWSIFCSKACSQRREDVRIPRNDMTIMETQRVCRECPENGGSCCCGRPRVLIGMRLKPVTHP